MTKKLRACPIKGKYHASIRDAKTGEILYTSRGYDRWEPAYLRARDRLNDFSDRMCHVFKHNPDGKYCITFTD